MLAGNLKNFQQPYQEVPTQNKFKNRTKYKIKQKGIRIANY